MRKNFFTFFFFNFFTFSLSPYGNNQNHLLFPPFLSSEIEKPQGKTSYKNFFFFFFFFFFCTLPLLVIGKITTYIFFRNSDLKCAKMPLSALKFHFLQITFFPPWLRGHIHLPTHTPFFRHIMPKKRAEHLFLKITFFCSLLLLLIPETLPNHLFRQTSDQKWSKNLPKRGKFFFFFYNFFHIFSLPLRK